jgi:hypothetical protein
MFLRGGELRVQILRGVAFVLRDICSRDKASELALLVVGPMLVLPFYDLLCLIHRASAAFLAM